MKKWIIALAGLAALWAVHPFHGVDAGSLCVVETLLIEAKQGQVQVAAGTLEGNGETVPEALKDMAENTPGTLFLRQVRRIILCGLPRRLLREARSCIICAMNSQTGIPILMI